MKSHRATCYRNSLAAVSAVGVLISIYAFHVESRHEQDNTYEALCDISERVSCTKVFSSKWVDSNWIKERKQNLLSHKQLIWLLSISLFPSTCRYGRGMGIVGEILGHDHPLNQPNGLYGVFHYTLMLLLSKRIITSSSTPLKLPTTLVQFQALSMPHRLRGCKWSWVAPLACSLSTWLTCSTSSWRTFASSACLSTSSTLSLCTWPTDGRSNWLVLPPLQHRQQRRRDVWNRKRCNNNKSCSG